MKLARSEFDSEHYALNIGRWEPQPGDGEPELARARDAGYDVVFVRVEEHDPLRTLLERTTPCVDTLVTSVLGPERASARASDLAIEHHDALSGADVERVASLTAGSIVTSHLHADSRLPLAKTRALYATWARNDVTGRAQRVIVARDGGQIIGYISVLIRDVAIIDLVAVDPRRQGHGIGSSMLASFTRWVDERRLGASVGTQADNPALRLYARHGFVPATRHFTYHLWAS